MKRNNNNKRPRRGNKLKPTVDMTSNYKDLDEIPQHIERFRGLGIPDRLYCNLAYDQSNLAVIASAVTGTYLFSGNSCFDPDTSGIGHQPFYFDQFVQLYNRYRVHKAEIIVELINSTISSHLTITPTTDGNWPANVQQALESTYTSSMPISSSVFRNIKTREISTRTIWGMQSISQDDLYQAVYSASPVRQWYWKICGTTFDGASTGSVRVNVRVVYHVEFFDRYPIGTSITEEIQTKSVGVSRTR